MRGFNNSEYEERVKKITTQYAWKWYWFNAHYFTSLILDILQV